MTRGEMDDISVPQIDNEACIGCGLCVTHCPEDVVALEAHKPVLLRPQACTYCGACESVCPVNAIALPYIIVWDGNVDAAGSPDRVG